MYQDVVILSDIQIVPIPPKDGLVAFCSFKINRSLFAGCIAIYSSPSSPDGFRLVWPSKNGMSCINPLNRETGEMIQKEVISRYLEVINSLLRIEERSGVKPNRLYQEAKPKAYT